MAVDKGYNDYGWYNQLTNQGIFFVTRLKSNAKHRVTHRHSVVKGKAVIGDQTIAFIIDEVVQKIKDGTIGEYYYDVESVALILR